MAIHPASPAGEHATLTVGDVRAYADRLGREVVTVPDVIALRLAEQIRGGWVEFRGLATGQSERFLPGSWVYCATGLLLAGYASSPVPVELTGDARRIADLGRAGSTLPAMVVGESAYDPGSGWWNNWSHDLHVPGRPRSCDGYYIYEG